MGIPSQPRHQTLTFHSHAWQADSNIHAKPAPNLVAAIVKHYCKLADSRRLKKMWTYWQTDSFKGRYFKRRNFKSLGRRMKTKHTNLVHLKFWYPIKLETCSLSAWLRAADSGLVKNSQPNLLACIGRVGSKQHLEITVYKLLPMTCFIMRCRLNFFSAIPTTWLSAGSTHLRPISSDSRLRLGLQASQNLTTYPAMHSKQQIETAITRISYRYIYYSV